MKQLSFDFNGSTSGAVTTPQESSDQASPRKPDDRPICTNLQGRGHTKRGYKGAEAQRRKPDHPEKGKRPHPTQKLSATWDSPYNWREEGEGSTEEGVKKSLHARETAKKGTSEPEAPDEPQIHSGQLLQEGADPSLKWLPSKDHRQTCSAPVRERIFLHHPDAKTDDRVLRWIYLALFGSYLDQDTHRRVISWEMLEWVCGKPFTFRSGSSSWTGRRILEYLRDETSLTGLSWVEWIAEEKCRTIEDDGIHPAVRRAVDQDLHSPPSKIMDRVYVLTGEPMHQRHGRDARRRMARVLGSEAESAPSTTSRRIWQHMNAVDARHLHRITEHIPAAIERIRTRPYDVSATRCDTETHEEHQARERRLTRWLKRYHLNVLRAIEGQHKPFYRFSGAGRTDRIFGWNRSVLDLPRDVRSILCQGLHNIDLKSAHLCIAASLWQAESVQERVSDPSFSVWDSLAEHYAPLVERATGDPTPSPGLYRRMKGALKPAVYSLVYGMPEPNVKGKLTKRMRDVFGYDVGSEAGMHFGRHDLMRSLFDARARVRGELLRNGGMEAADGRRITLNLDLDNPAASVLATVAQSYEQELMSVLVDYEQHREQAVSRNRFNVLLWLHDGAYVRLRSPRARMKDVRERLAEKAADLGVIAHFDHEPVTPPTDA